MLSDAIGLRLNSAELTRTVTGVVLGTQDRGLVETSGGRPQAELSHLSGMPGPAPQHIA